MKNGWFIALLCFWIPLPGNGQGSKKEIKNARESGDSSWVILNTGEKRKINDISFPSHRKESKGKIEFANGEKKSFANGEVITCQTDNEFYKLTYYNPNGPEGRVVGSVNK